MRLTLLAPALFAAVVLSYSDPLPSNGWESWSPRAGISPQFSREESRLRIKTAGASDYGAWQQAITNFMPGRAYRFTAHFKTEGTQNETRSVIPRLEWIDSKGRMARPPEYVRAIRTASGWRIAELTTTAPENAASLLIQLGFGFAANASVDWGDIRMEEIQDLPNRTVRTVTVFHRPRGTRSAAESVEQFCQIAKQSAPRRPDVVCLPEGITVVGTGKTYWEVGETVPGPTIERLASLARELNSYVVAGIYERDDELLYNTAVLVGRDGKLVGKYRKTHLPREEWEAGITPGDSYPVFDTDFGKVGLIICWDVQFPEPSRAMARQGAEVLLLPIWGGNETLAKARAIENHVFLVSSSYDMKTFIVDPTGVVLAEASTQQPLAFAELMLDKKYYQPWLGDMKHRTWKERRPDIPLD